MNKKELQLVTWEQAKRLKALGFDWGSDKLYVGSSLVRAGSEDFPLEKDIDTYSNWNDEGYEWDDGVEKEWFSAPTVALALKWLRDAKNVKNSICLCKWNSTRDGSTRIVYQPSIECKLRFEYDSYEEAENELLDELLNILEKEEQQWDLKQ